VQRRAGAVTGFRVKYCVSRSTSQGRRRAASHAEPAP
jgi:hypothetical protein